jgi:hypothetical protein
VSSPGVAGWCVDLLCRTLDASERETVRGDLAEAGEGGGAALRGVLGLVVRRQMAEWRGLRPWVCVVCLLPMGALLAHVAWRTAASSAIYLWLFGSGVDRYLLRNAGYWHGVGESGPRVLLTWGWLVFVSWACGALAGWISRRTVGVSGVLLCLVVATERVWVETGFWDVPRWRIVGLRPDPNAAVFAHGFFRVGVPLVVGLGMVLLPAVRGMIDGRELGEGRMG